MALFACTGEPDPPASPDAPVSPAPSTAVAPDPPAGPLERRFPDRQPDLALVVIDTLRVSRLGLAGASPDPMPRLSAMAARSVRFSRALSTSTWTAPATASILTGRYPSSHGVIMGLRVSPEGGRQTLDVIPLQVPSVAEVLVEAGWSTVGVAANYNIGAELGLTRGLEHFDKARPTADADRFAGVLAGFPAPDAQPRFSYLHYNDPHQPRSCRRDPCAGPESVYDSELSHLDAELADQLDRLRAQAAARQRDLAVVVTSDHGELFGEYGLRGHPPVLWHALQRALMVVQVPGVPPRVSPARVSVVDVAPTLLDLAGLPHDHLDGQSLVPALTGAGPGDDRPLFAHRADVQSGTMEHLWAVTRGDHKLVVQQRHRDLHPADQPEVPGESVQDPEREAALGAMLDAHVASARAASPEVVELTEDVVESLRAMGYIDDGAPSPGPSPGPGSEPR